MAKQNLAGVLVPVSLHGVLGYAVALQGCDDFLSEIKYLIN